MFFQVSLGWFQLLVRSPVDSCCDSCCDWLQASPLLSTFRAVNLESGRQGAQLVQLNCQIADARSRRPSHIASFVCLFVCLFVRLLACLLACLLGCLLVCLLVCLFVFLGQLHWFSLLSDCLSVCQSICLSTSAWKHTGRDTHTKKKKMQLHDLYTVHLHRNLDGLQRCLPVLRAYRNPALGVLYSVIHTSS